MPISAAIAGVGSLVGAGASIYGSTQAAKAQENAANAANARLQQQYQQNSQTLAPWISGGTNANALTQFLTGVSNTAPTGYSGVAGGAGSLVTPFQPTMAQLEQTPGYQFILGQGLKSTQNSYASKGLASSGAAMKGAADYATGLASNTYQQQFNNYWAQNKSIYNMLTGQANSGLQAAGYLTNSGNTLASQQGGNLVGIGNARAAMYNGIGNTVSNTANTLGQYALLSNYLGSNGTAPITNPAYWGGGSPFSGDAFGGSSGSPIPGLTIADYGPGF